MDRPDFLVIGAQRAGTTWLDRSLRAHPAIYLPERRKELHYFDQYYERGSEWYGSFFPAPGEVGDRQVGEITPRYLFDPRVAKRIHEDLPHVRLIAILRHPVDRAYSQYALTVRDDGERRPFAAWLEAVPEALERGRYAEQLRRYLDLFPREHLLVLRFETVMADREAALARVAAFLKVNPTGFSASDERVNASYQPRYPRARAAARRFGAILREHDLDWFVNVAKGLGIPDMFGNAGSLPRLDPAMRATLLEGFARDIEDLETVLAEDLTEWKTPAEVVA